VEPGMFHYAPTGLDQPLLHAVSDQWSILFGSTTDQSMKS
jgi:hypothetical protein